jgi:hypothetical protein
VTALVAAAVAGVGSVAGGGISSLSVSEVIGTGSPAARSMTRRDITGVGGFKPLGRAGVDDDDDV